MRRDHDQLLGGSSCGHSCPRSVPCRQPVAYVEHRVDARIAGHDDRALRDTPSVRDCEAAPSVAAKCSAASRVVSTRFISSGNGCHRSQVRNPASTCPTGILPIKSRQRAAQRGGGVSLHQDHVRHALAQHRFQRRQNSRSGLKQRLVRQHDVQIVIRHDLKRLQHLVQQCAVLRGDAHPDRKFGTLPEMEHHRAQLDGLRPGPEDEQDYVRALQRQPSCCITPAAVAAKSATPPSRDTWSEREAKT